MSIFGSTPPDESPSMRASLFDESSSIAQSQEQTQSTSNSLFQDDSSPWDMPTPRKQHSRADLLRTLLPASDVPESYIETFDNVIREDGAGGQVSSGGVTRVLASAKLDADAQAKIMSIVAPGGGEVALGRNEFNVLLGLVGLAQEGETVSLDGIDERRRNLPQPKLPGITDKPAAESPFARTSELAAKLPQRPITPPAKDSPATSRTPTAVTFRKPSMDYQDDPWSAPDLHKGHKHGGAEAPKSNGSETSNGTSGLNGSSNGVHDEPVLPTPSRTTSTFTTAAVNSSTNDDGPSSARQSTFVQTQSPGGAWGAEYFGAGPPAISGQATSPFGGSNGGRDPAEQRLLPQSRTIGSGRTGGAVEEQIFVTLLPEKEGMFMFQHHNYEVGSSRRGSKVIRRYSDFVWLLDCLHKRYPFRVLPLLPPKRVAVNGNHLSNDGAFIEKRRRGLQRFLNAIFRHPILSQEQLVIMFLTVPTELSVWRKQANLSVQDEFAGRALPPGLEDSLSPQLEELFQQTRNGIRRSAELYITVCNIMDRLVKRSEGIAADHARIAVALTSLTETTGDTYASDTNEVPLLNDGLVAMSRHLRTSQTLMEDESRAWDEGVLEDLKRQRDALVSVRDLFDRRDRLDKDNIPFLERRIQNNETKLTTLRSKPDGLVKPGEIERVVEAIIKDKESIVNQHNRSVFVKECIRDELLTFQSTQYHVSRWNQDWAQERVKYSEMLADNWRRLLDELEGMPLGE
ncbi:Sorting nexin mvp1 [Gnomoniopsis sp. IMI 355080]|nr:Sorting nexin mvp1 [Gnomoniopsis sp. IMI 355080]